MSVKHVVIPDGYKYALPFALILIVSPAFFFNGMAKTIVSANKPVAPAIPLLSSGRINPVFVREYETRLRPFFEARINGPVALAALSGAPQHPRENDILLLPRLWNSLSPEFKMLYKSATEIPADDDKMYVSPGGHFEVYYTTSDPTDAVDTTDTIGFGVGQNWRTKTSGKNGVPDYIDQVAWALDSAWSMEVDRFGFIAPLPLKDAQHTSNRYKVVVTSLGPDNYGDTWVDDQAAGAVKGFTSHIEIRNEWNEDVWNSLGYQQHPENGVRVTCPHEFFHGVQYAMSWTSDNDYFPLAWLEGTAVLMEGLAFFGIKDYLQYTDLFFSNPQMSFFDPNAYDNSVYTNCLLTKFMFEKGTAPDRIDLVKNIFFNDYAKITPFPPNLRTTSLNLGATWVGILNRFFTGSYYTGSRADTSLFLADAALMNEWTYFRDTISSSHATTKAVNPFGMALFDFAPSTGDNDTLSIVLECDTTSLDTVPYPYWDATCIMKRTMRPDSLFTLSIDPSGQARCRIIDWRQVKEMLVIVTNGHPSAVLNATVSPIACPVTYHAGDTAVFKDTLAAASAGKSLPDDFITVDLIAKNDLTCPLTLSTMNPASLPPPSNDMVLSGLFGLSYPEFWGSDASVTLTFFVRDSYLASLKNQFIVNNDSVAVYRYDNTMSTWKKMQTPAGKAADGTIWSLSAAGPGQYGLFMAELSADDTARLVIAPNPARISAKKGMYFEVGMINEVRIYSAGAGLVCTTRDSRSNAFQHYIGGYVWQLVNSRGSPVAPGYYTAVIIQTDPSTNVKKSKLSKVLVFP